MPELPEVETVVRGLAPVLEGARLTSVVARRPDLRWPLPADLGQRLEGSTILSVSRRAKYGLIATDRGDTLLFHLGMSGRFRLDPESLLPHDHVILETAGHRLAFHDPRRFGSLHLVATAKAQAHPLLARLGPEPLSDAFTAAHLAQAAAGRLTPVKSLLLDQHVVAGIGNIYACEALFRAGINPARKAGFIATARLDRLVAALKTVLAEAIAAGGSTLRDHAQLSGDLGYFQHRFQVYGREGQSCPVCGTGIRRRVQAGRSTFACPHCQT
jgi:formamidopyrimidine-DNA glycosylase